MTVVLISVSFFLHWLDKSLLLFIIVNINQVFLSNSIQSLESQWEEQSHSEQILRGQLKTLQEDLRRVLRQVEKGMKDKEALIGKIGR